MSNLNFGRFILKSKFNILRGYLILFSIFFLNCQLDAQYIEFQYEANGNMILKERQIEVHDFTIVGSSIVCKGDLIELSISTNEIASWSTGGMSTMITLTVVSDTIISAKVFNSYGCEFLHSLKIFAKELPTKPIIERHGDSLIVFNVTGEFTWYRNNQIFSTGLSFVRTDLPDSFTVSVTSPDGCSSLSDPYIITSTLWATESTIEFYPNPASDFLKFNVSQQYDMLSVLILDAMGKEILHISELEISNTVDITQIPPGYYFIRCIYEDNQSFISSFVKI